MTKCWEVTFTLRVLKGTSPSGINRRLTRLTTHTTTQHARDIMVLRESTTNMYMQPDYSNISTGGGSGGVGTSNNNHLRHHHQQPAQQSQQQAQQHHQSAAKQQAKVRIAYIVHTQCTHAYYYEVQRPAREFAHSQEIVFLGFVLKPHASGTLEPNIARATWEPKASTHNAATSAQKNSQSKSDDISVYANKHWDAFFRCCCWTCCLQTRKCFFLFKIIITSNIFWIFWLHNCAGE